MSPIPEPKMCSVVVDGTPCKKPAMYKLNAKGFCEEHKPKPQTVLSQYPRGVSPFFRPY